MSNIGITCYPSLGGSGAVATELGLWLAGRGHKVHFITYELPFRLRDRTTENVFYHKVNLQDYHLFKYPPYTLALAVKMSEVAMWHQLDILHVHYAIPHAVSAFLAREMQEGHLKYVTTLHGTDVTLIGQDPSYTEITRMAIQKSNAVTAVSNSLREDTLRGFHTTRPIEVIPNFVDRRHFYPADEKFAPKAAGREKVLVHVSNFRHVKRVDHLIKVFHKVQQAIPARLLLVGDGEAMAQVHQLCKQFGICDRVEFLGEQDCVADILRRSDLFVLPSELESFGLAALEAMACGVPVVATRIGGLPEVIEHGRQGLLVELGNIDAMTEACLKVLDDGKHHEFARAAFERSQKYDIELIGPQYEEVYRKLAR